MIPTRSSGCACHSAFSKLSANFGGGFTAASEQDIWSIFPEIVQDVFGGNVVAVVFVVAMLLSYALPENMEVTH